MKKNKILYGLSPEGRKIEIELEDGKIKKILPSHKNDLNDYIIPGFIDIHTHGGYGFDWTEADIEKAKKYLNKIATLEGTTSVLGTTITTKKKIIKKAISTNKILINKNLNGANLLGFHLEGPFLSHEKKGGHPEEELQTLSLERLNYFISENPNVIKLTTYAPETAGIEGIKIFNDAGIIVSIGHTTANAELAKKAFLYGAKSVTHFNNAMMKIDSKENSFAKYALSSQEYIEFINDGIHNPLALAKEIYSNKSEDKIILITDSLSLKGLPDGIYSGPNWDLHKKNGAIFTPTGILNGSIYNMHQAFIDWIKKVGSTIPQAVKATSTNAANLLKINKGKIEEGYDADLIILDQSFNIKEVIIGGRKIENE